MSQLTEGHASAEHIQIGIFVQATLNYLVDSSERPAIYTYEPPPGTPKTTGKFEPRSVLIRNARLGEELSLDRQGFQLVRQETARSARFYDRTEVEMVYYPEIGVLLKEATGAEKVVVFDHQFATLNSRSEVKETPGSTSGRYTTTIRQSLDRAACGITCQPPKRRRDCGIASRK